MTRMEGEKMTGAGMEMEWHAMLKEREALLDAYRAEVEARLDKPSVLKALLAGEAPVIEEIPVVEDDDDEMGEEGEEWVTETPIVVRIAGQAARFESRRHIDMCGWDFLADWPWRARDPEVWDFLGCPEKAQALRQRVEIT